MQAQPSKPSMSQQDILAYYSNPVIASAICNASAGREAVGRYGGENYDSRPGIIQYPADIAQFVQKGITSFHISVEHWKFPMALAADRTDKYDSLRTGWDLLIDLDSSIGIDAAKSAAILIADVLKKYGINPGIKFSGSRGFHICVPCDAFPREIDFRPMALQYPRIPQIIASFIQEKISDRLLDKLLAQHSLKDLLAKLETPPSEISPFLFVELEKGWGVRHLFRSPYSLNEKSWLASLPMKRSQLDSFTPDIAKPSAVLESGKTEDFFIPQPGTAERLLVDAMDWHAIRTKPEPKVLPRQPVRYEARIPEEHFPPCIKAILAGMKDGKKRSTFTLINFLRHANWTMPEIEARLKEWNTKNSPALPQNYINSQLHYFSRQRIINPANCSSDLFYKSIGICRPDRICTGGTQEIKIKNPLSYPMKSLGPVIRKAKVEAREEARQNFRKGAGKRKPQIKPGRGFACDMCPREFPTMRRLHLHRSRAHGVSD